MVLRHQNFLNRSSTELQVKFNFRLDPRIKIDNVRVVSSISEKDVLPIKSVEVVNSVIRIITLPQISLSSYYVEMVSTPDQPFCDATGTEYLTEDRVNNRIYFLGLEEDNRVKENLLSIMPPVYDTDGNTLVRKHIINVGEAIFRAHVDIAETANANFIKETIKNEIHSRGAGAKDRLGFESAYQVDRVGLTPEGTPTTIRKLSYNPSNMTGLLGDLSNQANPLIGSFPIVPTSLQEVSVDEVVSNTERILNSFSGKYLTLSHKDIIRVNSIQLVRDQTTYTYSIPTYKYAILDNRYDSAAFKLLTLGSNQIKLSDAAVINNDWPEPTSTDQIYVNYTYKNRGISIDDSSIELYSMGEATREPIGSLLSVFSLKNFPIVSASDKIITYGGVSFLDPQPSTAQPYSVKHRAFLNEIIYDFNKLPSAPGEYSIDYASGRVFVYGIDNSASGTGYSPPVASYVYRKTYVENIDYVFSAESSEIVAVSGRDIIGSSALVNFTYAETLIPNIDYVAEVHCEVIDEYVENAIINNNIILPRNYPLTNTLRVINETTGERYRIVRTTDRMIYIDGFQLPRIENVIQEPAILTRVDHEEIFISDILSSNGSQQLVKIELANTQIAAFSGNRIASNVNTSLMLNDIHLFAREFFYDSVLQSLSLNLSKLTTIGDFMVDYQKGTIYAITQVNIDFDLDFASYQHMAVVPTHSNVVGVNDIFYQVGGADSAARTVDFSSFAAHQVLINNVPFSMERFLLDDPNKLVLLGAIQYGVLGRWTRGSSTFYAADANFTTAMADGYHLLRLASDTDRAIISMVDEHTIIVDQPFEDNDVEVSWTVIDANPFFPSLVADGYKTITSYDIRGIRGVYLIDELQSLPADELTNYWNPSLDKFSGNTISFKNNLIKNIEIGTALAVDYDYGTLMLSYSYLRDNLRISYEWGDNQIHFISDALKEGDEYYASYQYGALRESLISNFAALTQIPELTSLDVNFDRELLRDCIEAVLHAFVAGPTRNSIVGLVENITEINPQISELTFNEWTSGRDNLYLAPGKWTGPRIYDIMKYGMGLKFAPGNSLTYPGESYISYREGTFSTILKADWAGIDNDAVLTFNLTEDGYSLGTQSSYVDGGGISDGYGISLADVFIGARAWNPTSTIFKLQRNDPEPYSPVGMPINFGERPGYYVWLDEDSHHWVSRFLSTDERGFSADITSTGAIYDKVDGYSDNFSYAGLDGYIDGYFLQDGLEFSSDEEHYIFDAGVALTNNRLCLYKDGSGYLNFRVYDNSGYDHPGRSRFYNISTNIQHWSSKDLHTIAASWRLNTVEGRDELHLFIDGLEVSNLYKYGGKPEVGPGQVLRSVAEEIITPSLPSNIRHGADGHTIVGQTLFAVDDGSFILDGIAPGSALYILDATIDNYNGPFVVASIVDDTTLHTTTPFNLTLDKVRYSLNTASFSTQTNADVENIAIWVDDGYGSRYELNGADADFPDYSIFRIGGQNIIRLEGNLNVGSSISVNTLGLTKGRNRACIYKYDSSNFLKTRLVPPADIDNFDIYKVPFRRTEIANGGTPGQISGTFSTAGITATGHFTDIAQPSNMVNGKKYKITLHGQNNIDFSLTNQVLLTGTTWSGATSETIAFTEYGFKTTINYFKTLSAIDFTFNSLDGYQPWGATEIIEATSLTDSENSGDHAQLVDYENGRFQLMTFGSGNVAYNLSPGFYILDYPVALNIELKHKGALKIGTNLLGEKSLCGTLEQVSFLNEMLTDVRPGEIARGARSITSDHNSPLKSLPTPQTLMLLDLDRRLTNRSGFYKTFQERFLTSAISVNEKFGDALVLNQRQNIFRIDNAAEVFRNNEGTAEFWISPLLDTQNDDESTRFLLDISSSRILNIESFTRKSINLPARARHINSITIAGDPARRNLMGSSARLSADGRTITLGQSLPAQHTRLIIDYVPIDFSGNRMSIYKDGYGMLNYSIITDDDKAFIISTPINWKRDSWHRIKFTWDLNNANNVDRMRLFVDGFEGGSLLWGTPGLIYGNGAIYGSAPAGSTQADFLTSDINFTDTIGEITLGNSYNGHHPYYVKIDNLRFSFGVRAPVSIGRVNLDLNYNDNLAAVFPVITDAITSGLYDFDRNPEQTEFLSNLVSRYSSLFKFDVNVDDGFSKVNDELARKVLTALLERVRPAHTSILTRFLKEDI